MNIIAIIPARGGSKSIPKKNIKLLAGKPLIAYPIELAKSVPEIDRVIVSTDSEEIAAVARQYEAEVPFIRPAELAQDETPTLPVLQHCVKYLEEKENYKADVVVLLYPTCPFLNKERVQEAISLLKEGKCHSVVSATKDFGRYWAHDAKKGDYAVFYPKERINRQYYQPLYKENGAIYFSDYDALMKKKVIVDEESVKFVLMDEEEVVDIDTKTDWKRAEQRKNQAKYFEINTPKGKRGIGEGYPTFIVAEMSSNHNQNYEKAVEIIKAAAKAGADAIKLQTYTPDTITMDCDKPCFVIKNEENPECWQNKTLYQLYQKSYTPWEWHEQLKKVAEKEGLVFFSSPFDETAVDFLEKLNVLLYKIASYEVTHIPLLKKIAQTKKPVIMSIGFAALDEVELAIKTLRENGTKDIIVLHCVTAYTKNPQPEQTNFRTMLDLCERFEVLSGFSDNNAGIELPLQAAMLGAAVIEKHFVADEEKTSDSDFSLGPEEFARMVQAVRTAEKALGEVHYGPQSQTEKNNMVYRRSLFAVQNIKKGEIFTEKNVRVIRPAFGLAPKHYWEVLGKTAAADIEKGTPLNWEMVRK